jgi:hypothetical protein
MYIYATENMLSHHKADADDGFHCRRALFAGEICSISFGQNLTLREKGTSVLELLEILLLV